MKKDRGFTLTSKACQGFTLIELLVVISIIGILISLSFVGFLQARKTARDSKRKADLEQIRSSLEIYRNDLKTYPPNLGILKSTGYIGDLPADPLSPTYTYDYHFDSSYPNRYYLCSFLENEAARVTECGACGTDACNYQTTNP